MSYSLLIGLSGGMSGLFLPLLPTTNSVFHFSESIRSCLILLFIVVLAVQQAVPAVTGPGERAQTHGAFDAGLVPGALVHAQQEAVGDGRLAACTHLSSSPVLRTWRIETQKKQAKARICKILRSWVKVSNHTAKIKWLLPNSPPSSAEI